MEFTHLSGWPMQGPASSPERGANSTRPTFGPIQVLLPQRRRRRKLDFYKCSFCRRAKQKCVPSERQWPGQKCERCTEKNLPCSPSTRRDKKSAASLSSPSYKGSESGSGIDGRLMLHPKGSNGISSNAPLLMAQGSFSLAVSRSEDNMSPLSIELDLDKLVRFISKRSGNREPRSFHEHVRALMPGLTPMAMLPEAALLHSRQETALQFLQLTIFMVSNNMFRSVLDTSNTVYRWLQGRPQTYILEYLHLMKGPTAEALVENLLRLAIDAEDVRTVQQLMKAGLNPNEHVCFGHEYSKPHRITPLQRACDLCNVEIVTALLNAGADANKTLSRNSPLMSVLDFYYRDELIDPNQILIIRELITAGADVNCIVEDVSPLYRAADIGHVKVVALLVSEHANVNFSNPEFGDTALTVALNPYGDVSDNDALAISEILIRAGANVNAEFYYEGSGYRWHLEMAVKRGPKVFDFLLQSGARPTQSALECAVVLDEYKITKQLIDAGMIVTANIIKSAAYHASLELLLFLLEAVTEDNVKDRYSSVALTEAIRAGKDEVINQLISPKIQVHGNSDLAGAIEAAAARGDNRVLRMLFSNGSRHRSTAIEWLGDSLSVAISQNRLETVEILLDAAVHSADVGMRPGTTSLLEALKQKNADLVRRLLVAGAAVNNEESHRSLMCEPAYITTVLPLAVRWGYYPIVQELLDAGADIDAPEVGGHKTALTVAVERGERALVDLLVEAGANINSVITRIQGPTPLEVAVLQGNIDLVRHLLQLGADPDDEGALCAAIPSRIELVRELLVAASWRLPPRGKNFGCHALQIAISLELPAIISLLLAFGVDANKPINRQRDMVHYNQDMWLQSSFGESCFGTAIRRDKSQDLWIVRMLLKMGANPNSIATERPKRTPLLAAIELQNLSLVKILISAGAEVNRTAAGVITRTPLQMAAELGNVEILEELLRNSAKVNALPADMYGATALQFAAIGGYVGIAKILLEIGADVDAAGARIGGRTALEAAAEHGRIDMLQLLLDYRAQIIGSGEEQYQRAVRFAQENGHLAVGRLLENILLASNDHEQTSPSEWMTWCS